MSNLRFKKGYALKSIKAIKLGEAQLLNAPAAGKSQLTIM